MILSVDSVSPWFIRLQDSGFGIQDSGFGIPRSNDMNIDVEIISDAV
jgi:hypothetical protein